MSTRVVLEVERLVELAMAAGDGDPEASHGAIDDATERVVQAVASEEPGAKQAAVLVASLIACRNREGWRRWYA